MSYIDFNPNNDNAISPNTVWTWVNTDSGWKWSSEPLKHMVAGDTDSGMFTLKDVFDEDFDDMGVVTEVADTIGKMVDSEFPDMIEFAFNCPAERRDAIRTDREIVFDKALFLSKKRYIMHVVDDEGKKVDKLKIMGVEIIKSDTSEAVKSILMEMVNMILDGKDKDALDARIKEMKEEIKSKPIQEISTPCGSKTITKVQELYDATGSLKGAHYAAKAAFWWNKIKTPQEEAVFSGQKLGLVYVRHKDFNCIGFPIDMKTFPQWFLDIPIDYDRMWAGASKKITNYMASMEWDTQSIRSNIRNDLFGF